MKRLSAHLGHAVAVISMSSRLILYWKINFTINDLVSLAGLFRKKSTACMRTQMMIPTDTLKYTHMQI